jgi:hypothetical protein
MEKEASFCEFVVVYRVPCPAVDIRFLNIEFNMFVALTWEAVRKTNCKSPIQM